MNLNSTKYGILIKEYKNMIYSYACYMVKDTMDADDITQETMIRIWKNIEGVKLLAAKTWIIRTTHNLCIDFLRKRKSLKYSNADIHEEIYLELADNSIETNPQKITETRSFQEDIKEAIKLLPENLKSIFVMYHINGLKYKEIGKALDMPINTVKVYLLRARKKLQEDLNYYEI